MGPRLTFTVLLLSSAICCLGQNSYAQSIPDVTTALRNYHPDSTRARLLLDLALSYIYKPGENTTDLDSAQLLIQQADVINSHQHNDYLEARSCFVRSNALRERGDVAHGIVYARKATQLYVPHLEKGDAFIELAQYYDIYSENGLHMKQKCWQEALTQFQAGGAKEREAFALKNLADLDYELGNYGQALVRLQRSLELYNALHYPSIQGVYDLLGTIYYCLGDYLQAVKYGLLAVKTSEQVNDTTMQLCTICHRLSSAYMAWGKDEESHLYRKRSLDIALKYKDRKAIYTVYADPTDVRRREQHWQDLIKLTSDIQRDYPPKEVDDTIILYSNYVLCYAAGNKFGLAQPYADYLTGITKRNPSNYDIPLQPTFHCLVMYAAAAKQYSQLQQFTDKYITACKDISYPAGLPWAYLMKARADSGMGNYLSALQWSQLSRRMSDSMFNVTKSMQFSQLQVQYETEKKDKDLQLLTNKNQLQELSLSRMRSMIKTTG